mmetsp:Transcript_48011/g.89897  ORF Transcript_48011/g.89897 Transcript_48011/m.89897 type:complete len:187 (+) Transcript_48011:55-615(+)
MDLAGRLRAAGVEPPADALAGSTQAQDEAWRKCLEQLCEVYLGCQAPSSSVDQGAESTGAASEAMDEDGGLPPLPAEDQLSALRLRAESCRRRNFDLRCELDFAVRREGLLQRCAAEDPIMSLRSLSDFISCLRSVKDGCNLAAGELELESDQSAMSVDPVERPFGEVVEMLQAARERLAPLSRGR